MQDAQLTADGLRDRTKQFAIRLIRLYRALPRTGEAQIIGRQLLRSGASTAANYRAACRARSKSEFLSKLSIVVEEVDETLFWLELMSEGQIMRPRRLENLIKEANELTAIFAVSRRTARSGPPD